MNDLTSEEQTSVNDSEEVNQQLHEDIKTEIELDDPEKEGNI